MSIANNMMGFINSFQGGSEDELSEVERALIEQGVPLQSPGVNPYGLQGIGAPTPFNPVAQQQEKDEMQAAQMPQRYDPLQDNGNENIVGNMMKMFMGLGF